LTFPYIARAAADLANQLRDLKFEIGWRGAFSPGIDCGILIQRLVRDKPIDEVIRDHRNALESAQPLVKRFLNAGLLRSCSAANKYA
jgi:hypothetical protein